MYRKNNTFSFSMHIIHNECNTPPAYSWGCILGPFGVLLFFFLFVVRSSLFRFVPFNLLKPLQVLAVKVFLESKSIVCYKFTSTYLCKDDGWIMKVTHIYSVCSFHLFIYCFNCCQCCGAIFRYHICLYA